MKIYERGLGTSNKELQSFRKLDKKLSRVITREYKQDDRSILINHTILKNLLRSWFTQVGQIFKISSGTFCYFDRVGTPIFGYNFKEKFDWKEQIDEASYSNLISLNSLFIVDDDFVIFKFFIPTHGSVICGYKRIKNPFSETELGLLGEYISLLDERLKLYRRWDIERWKSKIVDRKTMLKELRPKSLFYNLLYSVHHIAPCNHSLTVLTLENKSLIASAELIKFSKVPSWRIENKLVLDNAEWDYLNSIDHFKLIHVSSIPQNSLELSLISHLYNSSEFPQPESVLLIPLKYKKEQGEITIALLLMADNRQAFFHSDDGAYIYSVINAVSATIYNSLNFGQRLEQFTKELEVQLMSNSVWDDNFYKILDVIKIHFEAKLCQICIFNYNEAKKARSKDTLKKTQFYFLDNGISDKFQVSNQSIFLRTLFSQTKIFNVKNIDDIEQFEFLSIVKDYNVKSVISLPIIFNNEILGFISCFFENARSFSQIEHYQLDSATHQIGAILAHRRRTQKQLNDLTKILSIMKNLSLLTDDRSVREKLVRETKEFLQADYCFISIPDESGKKLVTSAKTWGDEFVVPKIKMTGKPKDGITSYVGKRRKFYVSNDVSEDPFYKDINLLSSKRIKIQSEMAAPLLANKKLIGVIDVMSSQKNNFSLREQTLFQMLLSQSSLAIENSRVAREKLNHINIVNTLQSHLVKLSDPEKIYLMILENALFHMSQFHFGAEILGNLYVKRPNSSFLEVKAFIGERSAMFSPVQMIGEGIVGHVAKTGEGIIIRDTSRPPAKLRYQPFIKGIKQGSEISVPIKIGNEVNSVINLESPSKHLFSVKDLEILTALASEISVGVKFAQLYEVLYKEQEREFYHQEVKFLRVLSHEVMRSTKKTNAEIPKLRRRIGEDPESMEILERIDQEVQKTLSAESSLIPFAARRKYTSVDIIPLLNSIVARQRNVEEKIKFRKLIKSTEFFIKGNDDFVGFVFNNLIRNSIDATNHEGIITIEEINENSPTRMILHFSDNGHGIPSELNEKIWTPYFSDDGKGKPKGLGLGLWLVRDLVERMNGVIEVYESIPFEKTTFRLIFCQME